MIRNNIFGERLSKLLKEKGIKQREIAEMLGVDEVNISRYIHGTRIPRNETACKIAELLDTTVVYLFGLREQKENGLTANEYQKLAMRTCNIPYDQKNEMLYHAVFGLNSEAGEVAGILQKIYQQHPFDNEHMLKELGDCAWMLAEACTALGVDLETVLLMNIEKLKARFPDGFTAEKSLHRAEGDI